MRKRALRLVTALGVTLALVLTALFLLVPASKRAPDVEVTLLDGRTIPLPAWRGRIVLVSFWSVTCRPCLEERPDLIRLYTTMHPRGFALIAVAMPYDPPLAVRDFNTLYPVPYPIALDVQGHLTRRFSVDVIPAAFLIDPHGNIVYRQIGKLDTTKVRDMIEALLGTTTATHS